MEVILSLLGWGEGTQLAQRPGHAGLWGLARAARAEASMPLKCIDASLQLAILCGSMVTDSEAVLRNERIYGPRLMTAWPTMSRGVNNSPHPLISKPILTTVQIHHQG